MDVTLMGSAYSRRAVFLGDNGWNFWNSTSGGDRTYTALKASQLDFTKEKAYRMPYDTLSITSIVQPYKQRTNSDGVYQGPASDIQALERQLIMATKANEAYISAVRSYYDTRVSRTSGGKRARLRDERAILINEATAANKMAAAATLDLRALKVAEYKSQTQNDPDAIVVVTNPNSGRTEYTTQGPAASPASAYTSRVAPKANASDSNLGSLLLIPIGVVAAYFFAKG